MAATSNRDNSRKPSTASQDCYEESASTKGSEEYQRKLTYSFKRFYLAE